MGFDFNIFFWSFAAIWAAICTGSCAGGGRIGEALFGELVTVACFAWVALSATIWKEKEKGE